MSKKNTPPAGENDASNESQGHPILKRSVTFEVKTIKATEDGCLDPEDASDLVESCIGGSPLDLDTKLSDFLPTDAARKLFCTRVKNAAAAAGCTRPFPCAAGTKLGDIAAALSC